MTVQWTNKRFLRKRHHRVLKASFDRREACVEQEQLKFLNGITCLEKGSEAALSYSPYRALIFRQQFKAGTETNIQPPGFITLAA